MTVETREGQRIFSCDSCSEIEVGDADVSFTAAWDDLQEEGWRAEKIGIDWVHCCPSCHSKKSPWEKVNDQRGA